MISCDDHDYVEIACMHRLDIKLKLKCSETVQGIAIDTGYNQKKQECITLDSDSLQQQYVLDDILSMTALTKNPHFDTVIFG